MPIQFHNVYAYDANWCLLPHIISEVNESVVMSNIFHSLSGNGIGEQSGIAIGIALKECRLLEELQYV